MYNNYKYCYNNNYYNCIHYHNDYEFHIKLFLVDIF